MSIRDQIRYAPTMEEKKAIYDHAMTSTDFRFASDKTVRRWAKALHWKAPVLKNVNNTVA